jgi:hypothetical protein
MDKSEARNVGEYPTGIHREMNPAFVCFREKTDG